MMDFEAQGPAFMATPQDFATEKAEFFHEMIFWSDLIFDLDQFTKMIFL